MGIKDTTLAILTATTFAHSYVINRRRLEHFFYAPWSVVLNMLVSNHPDVLIPSPQYPIYTSPQALPAPDDPDQTLPDATAVGVYVDHVIILPRLCLLDQPKDSGLASVTLDRFLQSISEPVKYDSQWWPKVVIKTVEVPLMVEVKRAPTRNPKFLSRFYKQLADLVDMAQQQAAGQALCLFSSLSYRTQKQVILIAGAGNWWSCRLVRRNSPDFLKKAFDVSAYQALGKLYKELSDGEDEDDHQPESSSEELAPPMGVPQRKVETNWDLAARERAIRSQRQARERDERVQKRKEAANKKNKLAKAVDDLDGKAQYPYTDKDLREHSKLISEQFRQEYGMTYQFYYQEDFDPVKFRSAISWTGLMRFGSEISNRYMEFLQEELGRVVAKAQ